MRASALDQHRHLVGDKASVGIGGAERREATAVPGRCDEEQRLLQLDDGLADFADTEALAGAPGQALHRRGQSGQMFGVLAAQVPRCGDDKPVAREDHGFPEVVHTISEIVE